MNFQTVQPTIEVSLLKIKTNITKGLENKGTTRREINKIGNISHPITTRLIIKT